MRILSRAALAVYGVGLVGFGLLFLISPQALTEMVDTTMPTPVSTMDIRAVYGGMFLGIGAFWILAASRDRLLRPGLVSLAMTMGGLVVGRTAGLADGRPNALVLGLYVVEVAGTLVALVALRSSLRHDLEVGDQTTQP